MRIATLPKHSFVIGGPDAAGLHVVGPDERLNAPRLHASVGSFDPYYPLDPLAVSPDGRRAWVRGVDGMATRVALDERGRVERFGFALRDAVYGPEGSVFAVLDAHEQPTIVEFRDDDPTSWREITLGDAPHIHWPYGAPYQFAAYSFDWRGALRLTATRWGVALAHVSGLLWVHRCEGPGRHSERAWTMPPVYQGWTCAYLHADGVVVSSVHNGRTGDIVWLDHEGVWHGCFDSNWSAMGPCVPSPRGFVTAVDDTLLRFAGTPPRICEQTFVGGRIEDLACDLDARCVVAHFGDRAAQTCDDGQLVRVWMGDELDEATPELLIEPSREPAWRYQLIEDPQLGRVWQPELDRAHALAEQLRASPEPGAVLMDSLPGPALDADGGGLDALELVYRRLRRWIAPELSRAQLSAVVERLVHAPDDAYLTWALRSSLPASLRAAGRPREPVSTWIREHMPASFDGIARFDGEGERRIRQASIVADIHTRPVWSLHVELDDGGSARISLDELDIAALAAPPSELSDEFEVVRGRLRTTNASASEPVLVTLDPCFGGHAQRVTVKRPRGDAPLLLTAALFEPVELDDPAHARVLGYLPGSWPAFYLGQHHGRLCASPFADDLDDARLVEAPSPLPCARELLDALVGEELLELAAEPDDAMLWAVELAVLGSAADQATQALERLLLAHDSVDELYADHEQLREHVLRVRASVGL